MGHWTQAKRDRRCAHCHKPIVAGEDVWVPSAGVEYCSGCGLVDENAPVMIGPWEASVMAELAKFPPEAGEGIYAQNMIGLARDLDRGDVPPRERPQYTKEIRLNQLSLQDLFPPTEVDDETEEARRRRERRARESGGF